MIGFIYQRLTNAMTFDRGIHMTDLITESIMLDLFVLAFICDIIHTELDGLFSICVLLSVIMIGLFANRLKNISREKFLRKIDIFNYRKEFDALHMMIALHELIEMSQFNEREDFILRGFVERHIEICDFTECNCMDFYKIINSSYRIQLATIATMKEDENNKNSMSTFNKNATYDDETTQDDSSV